MVEGTKGSHHKGGSMKMAKRTTICAGIDTGKRKLDVALDGSYASCPPQLGQRTPPAVDLIHRNITASRICAIRYKLMHECALFDLASALTSTYV